MSFLTAEWRKLVFINYTVDPELLQEYVPKGTTLDSYNGKCFVSVIGFLFKNTKVLGCKMPSLHTFEEVNLRFYVKREENDIIKRGVVFIKEIVPKRILSFVANTVYHGPNGLKYIANKVHSNTVDLANTLEKLGFQQINSAYFDTIVIKANAGKVREVAEQNEVNFLYIDENTVGISINEATTARDLNDIAFIFATVAEKETITVAKTNTSKIEPSVARKTTFLEESVFNSYHSETEMMRYIKKLERKDLSLNHSMIALGSCTMKLNAAAEMLSLSSAQWNNIHPFVPVEQAEGYQILLKELEHQLNVVTGFAGTSLQPNSGAQGEFAGLMVIRAYHESRGDAHRNICLIPASAHGTNPASAVMAGMKVVVTKTTEDGNIDVDDLREKALKHKDNLSALMVTYPSTHAGSNF